LWHAFFTPLHRNKLPFCSFHRPHLLETRSQRGLA
jgi:hypothetical protein